VFLLLLVGVGVAAWWLTGVLRGYAVAHRLLDIPNARSSHLVATPRGGGLAIVLTVVVALPLLGMFGLLAWRAVWGLVSGGAVVAVVGFADDHGHLAVHQRLLGHIVAASWVVTCLGGLPPLVALGVIIELDWLGHGLAVLYLVWMLNLTNFMDGIDGIAAVEVISVCLGGALLCSIAARDSTQWAGPLILASATLGFLVWNWPPAKIFLGDTGSGFLGLVLAAFSLQAAWVAPRLFWGWVILLGAFIVDATVTLIRRIARGERFYEAHRNHAYQHAARRWATHRPVTLAVAAINLCWLLPLALLVVQGSVDGLLGIFVAYTPIVTLAIWLQAGTPSPA
jgi:Fuc2NAc and GlcNAc transferase